MYLSLPAGFASKLAERVLEAWNIDDSQSKHDSKGSDSENKIYICLYFINVFILLYAQDDTELRISVLRLNWIFE